MEYKNGTILKSYRNIISLSIVYIFRLTFQQNFHYTLIKIKVNLPIKSLDCQEYADMMARKWAMGSRREIKEQKLHRRASEMRHLENLFTLS